MKNLFSASLVLLFAATAAGHDPVEVPISIPGHHAKRVEQICEEFRRDMDPPREVLPLGECLRVILFRELRAKNGSMVEKKEAGEFDRGMAD